MKRGWRKKKDGGRRREGRGENRSPEKSREERKNEEKIGDGKRRE